MNRAPPGGCTGCSDAEIPDDAYITERVKGDVALEATFVARYAAVGALRSSGAPKRAWRRLPHAQTRRPVDAYSLRPPRPNRTSTAP